MPNQPSKISDWEKEFDKSFRVSRHPKVEGDFFLYHENAQKIKSFISNLLSTQRTKVLEEVIDLIPKKDSFYCINQFLELAEKINQLKNKEK